MGFWKKLFGRWQQDESEYEEVENENDGNYDFRVNPAQFNMEDSSQRERYVKSLLEQIADVQEAIKSLSGEYQTVTSYLVDIEELDGLPKEEKDSLLACAKSLETLEQARNANPIHKGSMPDSEYHRIEAEESELEKGVSKLREAENYQELIRRDLKRLDAEHQAYTYTRKEAAQSMNNLRSIARVFIVSMIICVLGLVLFKVFLSMDTGIGYILVALVTALVLTVIFVRFRDADREVERMNSNLDKLILLQNRVKIRYVNNTNLLDYYYVKFGTDSSKNLEKTLEDFRKERQLRSEYAKVMEDLDFFQKDMMRILRKYHLFDPTVWLYQYEALLKPAEMVEIRHKYNVRRQTLRGQIENNQKLADESMEEIKRVAMEYKEDSGKILRLIDEYREEEGK